MQGTHFEQRNTSSYFRGATKPKRGECFMQVRQEPLRFLRIQDSWVEIDSPYTSNSKRNKLCYPRRETIQRTRPTYMRMNRQMHKDMKRDKCIPGVFEKWVLLFFVYVSCECVIKSFGNRASMAEQRESERRKERWWVWRWTRKMRGKRHGGRSIYRDKTYYVFENRLLDKW